MLNMVVAEKNENGLYKCEVCKQYCKPIVKHPRIQQWTCFDCQDKILKISGINDNHFVKLCSDCEANP